APEPDAAGLVRRGDDRRVQVELVAVRGALHLAGVRELEDERAERLVLLLLDGIPHEGPPEETVRADEVALEDEPADLRQGARATLDRGRVRSPRPVRVLVELDPLLLGAP